MMLEAVIDINIVATTGADLNHLVRNILRSGFIIFIRLYMRKLEVNWLRELMLEDSEEHKLLEIYSLQQSFSFLFFDISGHRRILHAPR